MQYFKITLSDHATLTIPARSQYELELELAQRLPGEHITIEPLNAYELTK